MTEQENNLALIISDVQGFIEEEKRTKEIDRETAVANVLFEWRAYYRDDAPEYVDKYEKEIAYQILKDKLEHDLEGRMNKYRVPSGRNEFKIGVSGNELEEEIKSDLKEELAKRGEPV